jgi:hypothetical protein
LLIGGGGARPLIGYYFCEIFSLTNFPTPQKEKQKKEKIL